MSSRKSVKDELKVEKKDVKGSYEKKKELKLKGDWGYDCNQCKGSNHLAEDCMLRKKEEKNEKFKDETYYVERLEEIRSQTKNLSLVDKVNDEEDETY